MAKQIDLNVLRDTVLANQQSGQMVPTKPSESILVTKKGEIVQASDVDPIERRTFATVQQDTFHGRAEREIETVRKYMPANTQSHITEEGIRGWIYTFYCSFDRPYTMFAYFDGSFYQVVVVSPIVEERFCNEHTGHIYRDGRICMGYDCNSGRRTLEDAYAKSVLWATGMSSMLLSGNTTFPFSINNL